MTRMQAGLHEQGTAASRGRARCRGVIAVGFMAACGLVAQASCGFVSGSNTRMSLAGGNSMLSIANLRQQFVGRNTGRTAAAGTPRALDAAGKKFILESIKHDLQNQFTDGFVYTPFSPDMVYSTPFLSIRGKSTAAALKSVSPLAALHAFMVQEDSATFRLKSIKETTGDVNPFADLASPPWGKGQDNGQGATWAIHAQWEIEAQGRVQLSPVIEQKPFYLSGHDVFRMDAAGRVISHEKGFDQNLQSVASYFSPLHHIPGLDSILPAVAQKPEA